MAYVEVREEKSGYRITVPGARETPWVGGVEFVGPIIGTLGVRAIGEWETVLDEDGTPCQRALIL
jgi:hypothetical protein